MIWFSTDGRTVLTDVLGCAAIIMHPVDLAYNATSVSLVPFTLKNCLTANRSHCY